jgi:hypothetical protein
MQNASLVRLSATPIGREIVLQSQTNNPTISATALSSQTNNPTISATALSSITVVTARTLGPHDGLDSVCDG